MTNSTKLLLFFLSLFVLTNCQDKFDEYYKRPDWLAAPIYQQLESRGQFKHFLAAIDKAGYKQTLSAAGYWTLFAPNDAAFDKYFQEHNIAGGPQPVGGAGAAQWHPGRCPQALYRPHRERPTRYPEIYL